MDRDVVNLLHYGYFNKPIDWAAAMNFLHCKQDTLPPARPFLTGTEDAVQEVLVTFFKQAEEQLKTLPQPNWVFGFPIADDPRQPGEKRAAFVAFPFQLDGLDDVKQRIVAAGATRNFECKVPDESIVPGSIITDIWSKIRRAEVVVADLTGANPNVLYELGLAHALGKEVIAISQDDTDLPFDITTVRRTKYDLQNLNQLEATLVEAFGAVAPRYSFDPGVFRY